MSIFKSYNLKALLIVFFLLLIYILSFNDVFRNQTKESDEIKTNFNKDKILMYLDEKYPIGMEYKTTIAQLQKEVNFFYEVIGCGDTFHEIPTKVCNKGKKIVFKVNLKNRGTDTNTDNFTVSLFFKNIESLYEYDVSLTKMFTKNEEKETTDLLKKRVASGDAEAEWDLASYYMYGLAGINKDPQKAMELWKSSCNKGLLVACENFDTFKEENKDETSDN